MPKFSILGALGRAKDVDNVIELQDDDDVVYKIDADSTTDNFEVERNGTVVFFVGEGGAVTQATSASTGVTLNKLHGQITTVALTTAGAVEEEFTVTNSKVAATDVIACSTTYAGQGTPAVSVKGVAAGSFVINITNLSASALNAACVINFVVLKGGTS